MRSSKQIGAETFVKNNGERIVEKWNRGWGIDVWRIGLSEHTKEEEERRPIRYVFEVKESISDIFTELPCSRDLENLGQLMVLLPILAFIADAVDVVACIYVISSLCMFSRSRNLFCLQFHGATMSG